MENKNNSSLSGLLKTNSLVPYLALIAVFAALPAVVTAHHMRGVLIYIFIYSLASASLRFISISGQLSFAQGAFMGIGAYAAGLASKWLGIPWFVCIPSAAVISMVIGVITAYPFTRLRNINYTMCSLFLGTAITLAITVSSKWTGGSTGMTGISGIFSSQLANYYTIFIIVIVCMGVMYRIEHSQIGNDFSAIAQSHMVASSIGINERKYRTLGIAVGCFFAGVAGALYAHYGKILSTSSFGLNATLWLYMYMLVGGADSFSGPIIGTIVLRLIPELFRGLGIYADYVSVAALLIVVYAFPKGLAGLPQLISKRLEQRRLGRPNHSGSPKKVR